MNIKTKNYSKNVNQYLKDPNKMLNTFQDLIFIYPVVCDTNVAKHLEMIRSFFSINILQELYVNNYLNIVASATDVGNTNQDEMARSLNSMFKDNVQDTLALLQANEKIADTDEHKTREYQSKILEKSHKLYKTLQSHPQMKKLNPQVEIITLENMIDVPVIVGTQPYQIDTTFNLFFLLTAYSEKRNIGDEIGLKNNLKVLDKLKPEDLYILLNNIIYQSDELEDDKRLQKFLKSSSKIFSGIFNILKRIGSILTPQIIKDAKNEYGHIFFLEFFGRLINRTIKRVKSTVKNTVSNIFSRNSREIEGIRKDSSRIIDLIGDTKQSQLQIAKNQFEIVANRDKLMNKVGFGRSPKDDNITVSSVDDNIDRHINRIETEFNNSIGSVIKPFIRSYVKLMTTNEVIFSDSIISESFDEFYNKIQTYISENLSTEIKNSISGSTDIVKTLDILDEFCKSTVKDDETHKIISENDSINNYVSDLLEFFSDNKPEKTADSFNKINKFLNNLSSSSSNDIVKFQNLVKKLLEDNSSINSTLDRYIDELFEQLDGYIENHMANIGRSIHSDSHYIKIKNMINDIMPGKKVPTLSTAKTNFKESIKNLMSYIFYRILILFLCGINEKSKLSVEVQKNNVTSFPNYLMILPIETIKTCASVIYAQQFEDALNPSIIQNINKLSQNDLKGIIVNMNKDLQIPNLVVIDDETGTAFYKFMYNSELQKINLKTMRTYIDETRQGE